MSDWTLDVLGGYDAPVWSPSSEGSPVGEGPIVAVSPTYSANIAWPSASLAFFMPCLLQTARTVYGFGWLNGSTVSGNVDCGIYSAEGAQRAALGGVAQSGTSVVQTATLGSSVALDPGRYYMAMVADNVTGTFSRISTVGAPTLRVTGVAQEASAYPLPSTATFAAMAQAFIPLMFMAFGSVF